MQERIEASRLGRAVISVGVAVTVLAVAMLNLPDSHLRSGLLTVVGPFVRATGIDQDWAVFAPPRPTSILVEAHVEDADGTTSVVTMPNRTGPGAYVDYRWGKYQERMRLDESERLWEPYARFVADQVRAGGGAPVRVSLVRRWADTLPPGPGPERGPWQEFTFYTLPLG